MWITEIDMESGAASKSVCCINELTVRVMWSEVVRVKVVKVCMKVAVWKLLKREWWHGCKNIH